MREATHVHSRVCRMPMYAVNSILQDMPCSSSYLNMKGPPSARAWAAVASSAACLAVASRLVDMYARLAEGGSPAPTGARSSAQQYPSTDRLSSERLHGRSRLHAGSKRK